MTLPFYWGENLALDWANDLPKSPGSVLGKASTLTQDPPFCLPSHLSFQGSPLCSSNNQLSSPVGTGLFLSLCLFYSPWT